MSGQRRAGIIEIASNGITFDAKGNFSYNLGNPKREPIIGSSGVHGYTEKAQVAFVEGEVTDRDDLDVDALTQMKDATITLKLANGKTLMWRNAWYAADGTFNTDEANGQLRFEAKKGEEV